MNAKAETISWHERARTLSFRTQAFIDGRYLDAAAGATFDSINPATKGIRTPEAGYYLDAVSAREAGASA